MTLVSQAKNIKTNKRVARRYSKEEIDLALAWANDEIGLEQARQALKFTSSNQTYVFFAFALRQLIGDEIK